MRIATTEATEPDVAVNLLMLRTSVDHPRARRTPADSCACPSIQHSDEARIAKYQGTAVLPIQVGSDGLVHNARVIQGLRLGLDEQALAAVERWRFKSGMQDETPVIVLANIEVNFRLL
jgi:TonB family protein